MRKLIDENGNEVEVLEDEEIKELQSKAENNKTLQEEYDGLKKSLNIEEGKTASEAVDSLKKQIDPNWAEARDKIKRLEILNKTLQDEGKKIDDDGKIVDSAPVFDPLKVQEEARKAAVGEIINQRKEVLLSKYDDKQKEVVKDYFNRLATGTEVNMQNIETFMNEAERLSVPQNTQNIPNTYNNSFGGLPPKPVEKEKMSDEREAQASKELNLGLESDKK